MKPTRPRSPSVTTGGGSPRRVWFGTAAIVSVLVGLMMLTLAPGSGLHPTLRIDASAYAPGDVVNVELRGGWRPVGHNLCPAFATLERHDGAAWRPDAAAPSPGTDTPVVCTSELRSLAPLQRVEGAVRLPRDLAPGDYRVRYDLEVGGADHAVASAPFTVG